MLSPLAHGVELMRQRKYFAAREVIGPALNDAIPALLPFGYCLLGEAEVALHDDEAARRSYQLAIDLAGAAAAEGAAAVGIARCDARLGRHRSASRRLRSAVSRRAMGLPQHTAAAAALEAAEASVRAGDCAVAMRWLGAVLRCDSQRLALDARDRSNAAALLALLRVRSGDLDATSAGRALADCSGASLLGRCAARQLIPYHIGGRGEGGGASEATDGWDEERRFLERVALNACCLQSPAWAALDDKLGLHRALGRRLRGAPAPWWPPSFEMPRERQALMAFEEALGEEATEEAMDAEAQEAAEAVKAVSHPRWVLKSPRGYGGGGVRFLPRARDVPPSARGLVQQYVAPPLLLKSGRRATIRAYVIVLTSTHGTRAFLSRDGLVRFAVRQYDGRAEDAAQHLTNGAQAALTLGAAGGEAEGTRNEGNLDDGDFADENLEWLEDMLGGSTFARVTWPRVVNAAAMLVALAAEAEPSAPLWPHAALPRALPKILGLDFSLDAGGVPYLLELNRTPGLSPRGLADRATKHAVVDAAWSLWRGEVDAERDGEVDRPVELDQVDGRRLVELLPENAL